MNKLKILFFGALLFTLAGTLETKAQGIDTVKYRGDLMIYARAMRYNDVDVAKNALYSLVNMNPRNDSLLFSLAYMYFDQQNYISSILVSQDVLRVNPDHLAALEVSGLSYENIGARDKALESYESLYLKNNSVNVLYKMAFLQFETKKLSEAKTNAEILLGKKETAETKLVFPIEDQKEQEVPMIASVYNLLGLISKEEGNMTEAKNYFNKALETAPEFALAKNNLEELNK